MMLELHTLAKSNLMFSAISILQQKKIEKWAKYE